MRRSKYYVSRKPRIHITLRAFAAGRGIVWHVRGALSNNGWPHEGAKGICGFSGSGVIGACAMASKHVYGISLASSTLLARRRASRMVAIVARRHQAT